MCLIHHHTSFFVVLSEKAGAKVRISEQKTKKNSIFLLFSNESTFETTFQRYNKKVKSE